MAEHWTFNPQVLGSRPSILRMNIIDIDSILNLTTLIFTVSVMGVVLNRKNILIILMALETMLLSINLNFISFSVFIDDIVGQIFVLFILTIAATESAVGLSLLTAFYKLKNNIFVGEVS